MGWLDRLRGIRPDADLDIAAVDRELAELRSEQAQSADAEQTQDQIRKAANDLANDFVQRALPILLDDHTLGGWSVDDVLKAAQTGSGAALKGAVPEGAAFRFDPLDPMLVMPPEGQTTHPGTYGVAFETLRRMARHPIVSAVISKRVNQVAEFATPQPDNYSLGYRVVQRDRSKIATKASKRRAQEISEWLETCGDTRISGKLYTFETFLREITRDSLIFDQACAEIVPTKDGKDIAGFFAVDAGTIRRARLTEAEKKQGHREVHHGETAFVQVLNNQVMARFDSERLLFGVRRPRTDVKINGYGFPELEEVVATLGRIISAELYNAANFTNGNHTAGLIAIMARMDPKTWKAFAADFRARMQGPSNAHKTMVLQLDPTAKEDIKSVNLQNNNKEMEFMQWLGFLFKLLLAVYQMDPAEVNFVFGNEGQTSTMSQGGPAQRILASREGGLRPLLRAVQTWVNAAIVRRYDPDYELEFVGLDAEDEKARIESDSKAVKTYKTVNEVRAGHDMEKLDDPAADMLLDPTYVSASQQAAAAQQQGAPEQGAPGGEGAPGDDEDAPDEGGEQGGDFGFGPEDEPDEEIDFGDLFGKVAKGFVGVRSIGGEV